MAFSGEQFYKDAIDKYNKKATSDLAQQTAQADANRTSGLQQAYLQRMQNQKSLDNSLSQRGIRGGVTETANLNLINNYNTQRNSVNSDYANQVTQLQTNANDNMFNNQMQMQTAQAEYRQNMLMDLYNSQYSKSYSVSDLTKALAKASSDEQKIAINNRIAYLKAHKKKY